MDRDPIDVALEFLVDAFEREHQLSLFNIEVYAAADDDPSQWRKRKMYLDPDMLENGRAIVRPVKRLRKAPVRPMLRQRRHMNREQREEWRDRLRKRVVCKASLYEHPDHGFVVRCLVTGNGARHRREDIEIEMRWDVLVTDGVATLANTNQRVCFYCRGMSGLRNEECVGEGPDGSGFDSRCRSGGYDYAPTNDLGALGALVEIRRLGYPTKGFYQALYLADA